MALSGRLHDKELGVRMGWTGWLKALIPQHVSNVQLLNVLDICTCLKISEKKIRANHWANTEVFAKALSSGRSFYARGNYIENQPQWKQVKFGRYTMDYSGCEMIAACNALLSLGENLTEQGIADIISFFEKRGAALFGGWGVASRAIRRFFEGKGYETVMTCSRNPGEINRMGEEYDTVIITVYNDRKDITKQIHTMNVSKEDESHFVLHNSYRRDRDGSYISGIPRASLWETIESLHGGAAMPICMIGINPGSS